ncbi:thioredoxin family protein [Candidatus Woesearchaeota archaeon]|nr:thioredoxin family protein [Candidatus Woesearchaeota archaeon]
MKQKTLALIVVLALVLAAIAVLDRQKAAPRNNADSSPIAADIQGLSPEDAARIEEKARMYPIAPELAGISGYLNADENFTIAGQRGKVVLVDFWTYTCINCIRTLPHLVAWDRAYRDKGLVIIGVHTPEFAFEKKRENVAAAMEKHDIGYPVVQDNGYATWSAYRNRFWPRKYLIDADGFIRYDHIGEGAYDETEEMLQALLIEAGTLEEEMPVTGLPDETPRVLTTPELYAGAEFAIPRGQELGNGEGWQQGSAEYQLPETVPRDRITLNGTWRLEEQGLVSESDAQLFLLYSAASVNVVVNAERMLKIEVLLDSEPLPAAMAGQDILYEGDTARLRMDEPRLYNVVSGPLGRHLLELRVPAGFSIHAFTFG